MNYIGGARRLDAFLAYFGVISHNTRKEPEEICMKTHYYKLKHDGMRRVILTIKFTTHYQSRFHAFSNFVTKS